MEKSNLKKVAYKIKNGDTLFKIAKEYNTLVPLILADNPHISPHNLQVGEALYICPNCIISEEKPENIISIPPIAPAPIPNQSQLPVTPPPYQCKPEVLPHQNIYSPLPNHIPDIPYVPQTQPYVKNTSIRGWSNSENAYCIHNMRRVFSKMVNTKHKIIVSKVHNIGDFEYINNHSNNFAIQFSELMRSYYEPAKIEPLELLLTKHCTLFEDMLNTYITGDEKAVAETDFMLRQNADEISNALYIINPAFEPYSIRQAIDIHIDLMKNLIITRTAGEYKQNLQILENAENHAIELADIISSGMF